MRPGRAADHSPPSSAAVMEAWSYTSTHPLGHTGPVTGSLYFTFTILAIKLIFLVVFSKFAEATVGFVMPVRSSAWTAPNGWIFMKFGIEVFFSRMCREIQFSLTL